jgi:hypothetical protein
MKARLTYANIVATLCLALLLSGSAYAAAVQLSKDSVRSKHIKNDTVKSKDVRDGTLTAVDVKDGTLTGADVRAGEIDAEVAGTPMGGDLAGTFPNPTLAADALDGMVRDADLQAALAAYPTVGEVNDALTGALDDGVVLGDRDDASLNLPGPSTVQPLVSIPGVVSVTVRCSAPGGNDRGLEITITNEGVGTWTYLLRRYSQAGPAVDTIDSDTLLGGTDALEVFAPDDQTENVRHFSLTVLNGPLLELEISAITRNIANGCNVRGSVFLDGNGPV